jgi:hypothetical protein
MDDPVRGKFFQDKIFQEINKIAVIDENIRALLAMLAKVGAIDKEAASDIEDKSGSLTRELMYSAVEHLK